MSIDPDVSFGVNAIRHIPELDRVIDAVLAIETPLTTEVIVGLVTPGIAEPTERVDARGVRWIQLPPERGLGYNRNRVLEFARGSILVYLDDDCVPTPGWFGALMGPLEDLDIAATCGGVEIPPAGFLGDSISALGFPAGGSAGFETMFRVEPDGTTTNITTCNCALRTANVRAIGGFDESFNYGGEDTELGYRLSLDNQRIVYVREATVMHPARTGLASFVRWFYARGRAKAQFIRKVPLGTYASGRLASHFKILRAHLTDPKIVLIAPLLLASVALQGVGFVAEVVAPWRPPAR